jgi:hypothetical protein
MYGLVTRYSAVLCSATYRSSTDAPKSHRSPAAASPELPTVDIFFDATAAKLRLRSFTISIKGDWQGCSVSYTGWGYILRKMDKYGVYPERLTELKFSSAPWLKLLYWGSHGWVTVYLLGLVTILYWVAVSAHGLSRAVLRPSYTERSSQTDAWRALKSTIFASSFLWSNFHTSHRAITRDNKCSPS